MGFEREGGGLPFQRGAGIGGEERFHLGLVFFALERAGGIDEEAARLHLGAGFGQNLALHPAEDDQFFAVPIPARVGSPAEHAGVGTGRVHQHLVEGGGRKIAQRSGYLHFIGEPDALEILFEATATTRIHFARHEVRPAPGDLDRLAARSGAGVENFFAGGGSEETYRQLGAGVLHDEGTLGKAGFRLHPVPARQLSERAVRESEESIGRAIVVGAEFLGAIKTEAPGPAVHERVRETFADRERRAGEGVFQLFATPDEIAEDSIDHLGDAGVGALLGGVDRFGHGGEIRHAGEVENLRRADVEERLHLALGPGAHELREDELERAEVPDGGVDEVLDEGAVGSGLRQHGGREVPGDEPLGEDERGLATGVVHDA